MGCSILEGWSRGTSGASAREKSVPSKAGPSRQSSGVQGIPPGGVAGMDDETLLSEPWNVTSTPPNPTFSFPSPLLLLLGRQELKEKYSVSDLDALAEEEKRAWLEVVQEREGAVVRAASPGAGEEG